MDTPQGPPEPLGAAETSQHVRINTIMCVVAPLLISFTIVVSIGAVDGAIDQAGAWIGVLVGTAICAVPGLIGFIIALKWRKLHPGYYFLIGLGLSIASFCVLTALAIGACFAYFGIAV